MKFNVNPNYHALKYKGYSTSSKGHLKTLGGVINYYNSGPCLTLGYKWKAIRNLHYQDFMLLKRDFITSNCILYSQNIVMSIDIPQAMQ